MSVAPPGIHYPPGLPIVERRDELVAAIREHQVLVVAGETGSGKSTQLPKLCLEAGRGAERLIGHTQPRRLAARTIAERVAEELGTSVGGTVGYAVRFTDRVGRDTRIKLMTDGILLAEIQRDRMLRAYDTLIVDEAHERSLNIDFVLGYLKQLLPRRPDLKLVITSATIDTERFSRHFDDAPVVEVSGRTYPVEMRYRPFGEDPDDDRDQVAAIGDAVQELTREGPGDILVFLSGEREIRDTADALVKLDLRGTEILPLYARLSSAEQHRVFEPHRGRRVVLATNVAETSLTVPGVRYVIDPGTARISRYSRRTKVQRLPIEAVSQASANQRAGRCGRVAPGICIRLYSEDDFEARPEFTEPEILRTNLASVILQMTNIGLGDIAAFPFVEPPDARAVKDGVALLEELGAFADAGGRDGGDGGGGGGGGRRLSRIGKQMAQLPLDPRLARMLLEADRLGCVREMAVITAALSIQDPRERPTGLEQSAAEWHARFTKVGSDFIAFLELWEHLRHQQKELSSNQFRKLCRAEYLNHLRVREWQDVCTQVREVARGMGIRGAHAGEHAHPDKVHQAVLAGLLSHVGLLDDAGSGQAAPARRRGTPAPRGKQIEFRGAHGARFAIAPGSALHRKSPKWVVAAELVETSRLWGRVAARVQPEWIERLAGHLVHRSYSEPHWDAARGAVMAFERVTLYGLPLVEQRRVGYARIDPSVARELFIHHALVEGDWETHHAFVAANRDLVERIEALEERVRRRDLLVGDDAIFDFYDERIPHDVVSARHFDNWWKRAREETPDLLTMDESHVLRPGVGPVEEEAFPETWGIDEGPELALSYRFDPGAADDGVTAEVPLPLLNQVPSDVFEWGVPGLREELVIALIRTLPKPVRRNFVPAPEYARAFLAQAAPGEGSLIDALDEFLRRSTGEPIPPGSWQPEKIPDHLRVTFHVHDEAGETVAMGKDLDEIAAQLRGPMRDALAGVASSVERSGLRDWDFDELPQLVEAPWGGETVEAWPALVDDGDAVGVRLFPNQPEQAAAMRAGTRRLLLLTLPSPVKAVDRAVPAATKLALAKSSRLTVRQVFDDCVACAVDRLVAQHGGPAWTRTAFQRLRDDVKGGLAGSAASAVTIVGGIITAVAAIEERLAQLAPSATLRASLDDARAQLDRLVHPGFATEAGFARLADVLRYVTALERRLEVLPEKPVRDRREIETIHRLEAEYEVLVKEVGPDAASPVRWMIEELRVSAFAQSVGASGPVSAQRIVREMARIRG